MTANRIFRNSVSRVMPCLLVVACAPTLTVHEPELHGTFRGSTATGEPISLTFEEKDESFRGHGSIGDRPVAIAGPAVWRGVGALSERGGGDRAVGLALSADGDRLEISVEGADPLTLERASTVPSARAGPLSGRYRGSAGGDLASTVTLVQSGELLSGTGILLGDPFGVSGRVREDGSAEGVVTFADGTMNRFSATPIDQRTLRVRGLGAVLEWRRKVTK